MTAPYVQMARLNGLSEREVVFRHGLRNIALQVLCGIATLLDGTVVDSKRDSCQAQ
jgi:ABC-type dipeptide/oligopeptide/nickel transport system permease component